MHRFIPGLELSRQFYHNAVKPILDREFPGIPHSAALMGPGSEVLGYDTVRSMDHNWGPRLLLFLREIDAEQYGSSIVETLRQSLPRGFLGFPTSFSSPDAEGTLLLERTSSGPVNHKVDVLTLAGFLERRLGITSHRKIDLLDWLTFSEQALLEVSAGRVFHDDLGEVEPARAALRYYPRDVWLYLLAVQWQRIGQVEPFVGRCGEVGDDLGSALIAASLVRDLMRLCFLMARTYAPYPKWFGTAFARLPGASELGPILRAAVAAASRTERERHLSAVYTIVARRQNALGITAPLPTEVSPFHDRPFLVIHGERFAEAIRAQIADERVRRLPANVGSVDQLVDSTDVLSQVERRRQLRALYVGSG